MKLPAPKWTVDADARHRYTILKPTKEVVGPLTSVTTACGIIDKPNLISWSARVGAEHFKAEILRLGVKALSAVELERIFEEAKSKHRTIAKDAADLGTRCHDAFEAIILGKEPEGFPAELLEPIRAFKEWRLKSDIEIVATELKVGSVKHGFGGCIDAVGYSESRGGWGIVDYKTSSGFYGNEYAYQAGGGYAIAAGEQYDIDIKWSEIIRFAKKAPFESEGRSVTDMAAAAAGFLHALELARSCKLKLISEPTFASAGVLVEEKPKATAKTNGAAKTNGRKVPAGMKF